MQVSKHNWFPIRAGEYSLEKKDKEEEKQGEKLGLRSFFFFATDYSFHSRF